MGWGEGGEDGMSRLGACPEVRRHPRVMIDRSKMGQGGRQGGQHGGRQGGQSGRA